VIPARRKGRELEVAELLGFLRAQHVRNFVFLTADVHYCAAHHYHPDRAAFQDFEPFWEFVAGPLNAGSFGPNPLDKTFGPEVVFQKAPPTQNASPFAGFQFFGEVNIEGRAGDECGVAGFEWGGGFRAEVAACLKITGTAISPRPPEMSDRLGG
jgi:alkaline phosphatase D